MLSAHPRVLTVLLTATLYSNVFPAASALQAPADSSNPQASQIAAAMVKMHNAWGEKMSTNGAVLTLVQTARLNTGITCQIHAVGLPSSHLYSLIQWPVTRQNPAVVLQGVTINSSGLVICSGKAGACGTSAKPDDPVDLQTSPSLGEPLRIALVAQDDPNLRAAVKIVPVPNIGVNKGCRIEAVLLTPHAELIWLEASNLPANAEVALTQESAGEIQNSHPKTDGAGKLAWAIMPAKAGLKNGIIKIQVKAPGCSPEVSVDWATK